MNCDRGHWWRGSQKPEHPDWDKEGKINISWGSHLEVLQLGRAKEGWNPGQGQLVPDLTPDGLEKDS